MTIDKNTFPYNDDFSESKELYQIMFVPSRAVQARELTQIQSLLQNQIARFGSHVFKEGSMVIPGEMSVDLAYPYVKLETLYSSTEVNLANFLNKKVVGLTSGAMATVVQTEDEVGGDPKTLFIQYETGTSILPATGSISSGSTTVTSVSVNASLVLKVGMKVSGIGIPANTIISEILSASSIRLSSQATATNGTAVLSFTTASKFADDEVLRTIENGIADPVYEARTVDTSATGLGSRAIIKSGVYFAFGYFCFVDEQSLILDKYSQTPSYRVGLRAIESFITSSDDISLLDPAQGSPNFNAPGADRYKIEIVLSKFALNSDVFDNFIELLAIDSGQILRLVDNSRYSELEKTLARRTFDESGDYTVRAFPVELREHLNDGFNRGIFSLSNGGDDSKYVLRVEPGKAYVKGYELENKGIVQLTGNKARVSKYYNGSVIPFELGSYIEVNNLAGMFNISTHQTVDLVPVVKGGGGYPGTTYGTAKVRGVEFVSGNPGNSAAVYRVYLYDIAMVGSYKFQDIKGLRVSSIINCDAVLVGGQAILINSQKSASLLPLDRSAVKTLKDSFSTIDTLYTVKKYFSGTMTGNSLVISAGSTEIFEPYSVTNYSVAIISASATATGNSFSNGMVINLGAGGNSVTLGGSPVGKQVTITIPQIAGSQIAVIATVNKSSVQEKTKTLTTRTQTVAHGVTIQLDRADVFRIVSITDALTTGLITDRYTLDNGQRDSYYDRGKLFFNGGYTAPAGNVTIVYEFFAHGAGDFFSVDSYSGVIDYSDIQTYTSSAGMIYDLRDTIDFRPRIADAGGSYSVIGDMIAPASTFATDIDAYVPRYDTVVLSAAGEFKIIEGISSDYPIKPSVPKDSMALYEFLVPGYTFSVSDIFIKKLENKRYTMRDIGKLERRVENLEYYTALSLLEKETSQMFIPDDTGANKFKNGFIVDNFTSHLVGNLSLPEYQCSIDKASQILRPMFKSGNVGLDFVPGESTSYQKTGDLITLPYTSEVFIDQKFASKTENINPYEVFNWVGNVVLSPSSDEWYEETQAPDVVIEVDDGSAAFDGQIVWNDWQTDWVGESSIQSTVQTGSFTQQDWSRGKGWPIRVVNTFDQTIATETGQSRIGLQLNVIQSTNSEIIDDRVISETTIPWMRAKEVEFTVKTMKPNTKVYPFFDKLPVSSYVKPEVGDFGEDLITNNSGEVKGLFAIPNTDTVKFRTGERLFKLVDDPSDDVNFATTSAEGKYTAKGIIQTKQQTILSTRTGTVIPTFVQDSRTVIETSLRTVTTATGWYDPLAQTFLIEKEGGVFLSKIDIFFATKDTKGIPVTIQIRTTENGYPGGTILPFSEVTLNPSQVSTSANSSVATSFIFDSPVYLQDNVEYCFVLLANSTEYTIWCSRLGEFDVFSGERISQQPYAGVMFKSQNASTWTADQEQDIKFKIHRCVFNTAVTATATFKNKELGDITLGTDPFSTNNGSNTVIVYQPNHGLVTSGLVTISNVADPVNGIPAVQFNIQHNVTVLDMDYYSIDTVADATSTGNAGGVGIKAGRNMKLDVVCPILETLVLSGTAMGWAMRAKNSANVYPSDFTPIELKTNTFTRENKILFGADNEVSEKSVEIVSEFFSTVDNLSPVIDTERMSIIGISNRINDDSTGELDEASGNAYARYITRKVTLTTPAEGMNIYLNAIRPVGSDIKVYIKYRKDSDNSEFANLDYVEIPAISYPIAIDGLEREYRFELTDLDPFSLFSIKIVMLSDYTWSVPEIKTFKAIAVL